MLRPDDWRIEREMNLASKKDTPHEWRDSYEDILALSESNFRELLAEETSPRAVTFVAMRGGSPVGTIVGKSAPNYPAIRSR